MFVGDLFEKKKEEKSQEPRGFVGNKSQIAGVKRALDRAYQENPSARNDFEAMAGHIDKVDSLNAQQSRMLKQQEQENRVQTQQIQKLSKDITDKEQRFRDLNAQIANMPSVTPQQVAQMSQDLEKAHDNAKDGQTVDVPDIVAKRASQPAKQNTTGTRATPRAGSLNIAPTQQPRATPQQTTTTAQPAQPAQQSPGDTGARAFGAMAGQLAMPATTYQAKAKTADVIKKSAAKADELPANDVQPGDDIEPLSQADLDQLLASHEKEKAVAEAYQPGNPNIGGLNWTKLMQAWKLGDDHVDWTFPTNQTIRLYRANMFAVLQIVAGVVKKSGRAAQEEIIQDIFSNRNLTIDWLGQPLAQRYVAAYPSWLEKHQQKAADPQNPQGSLLGPDGQPSVAATKQNEPQQGELFKEDSWHDGKSAWSSEHDQWTKEGVENTKEGRMKDLALKRQEQTAGEQEPVGDFSVVRQGKDGQWQTLQQHYSSNRAFSHAQNLKNKYPSMQVGVRWPTGEINLVGIRESYWDKLQNERNKKLASLVNELTESIK